MSPEDYAAVALSRVPGIGAKLFRSLVAEFGTAVGVLEALPRELVRVAGVAGRTAAVFSDDRHHREAETICAFCDGKGVTVLYPAHPHYPPSLLAFTTAPAVLYYRGDASLAPARSVAVVGTRSMTSRGGEQVGRLLEPLRDSETLIISGLALGIDTAAHRHALACGLPTVAVLGSGFRHLYPSGNRKLAHQILAAGGGLLTEYPPDQTPEREHFPARNRIVAMLSQLTLVVESGLSGGSMITAGMARKFGRAVGACPGRPGDRATAGCNRLIKSGEARMIEDTDDLARAAGWKQRKLLSRPVRLFDDLDPADRAVVDTLSERDGLTVDELVHRLGVSRSALAGQLLSLELRGLILTLPGNRYRLGTG